jgi:hypothetical protein
LTRLGRFSQGRRQTAVDGAKLAPSSVYLLADNLDAALAAGEDLLSSTITWNAARGSSDGDIAHASREQREAINHVRSLEMILVARVLKARERAEELARTDERFGPMAKLFNVTTALLIEATAEFADQSVHKFDNGDAPIAYLRSRTLIAADAAAPVEGETLTIDDTFRIARRIELGSLLDMVAMFLDTLETHFDLFIIDPDEPSDADIDGP